MVDNRTGKDALLIAYCCPNIEDEPENTLIVYVEHKPGDSIEKEINLRCGHCDAFLMTVK